MRLDTRLLLVIGGIFGIVVVGDAYMAYADARTQALAALEAQAEKIRGVLMATREVYQKTFLENQVALTRETLPLLPAYSMSRIAKTFRDWDGSGLTFNNVSDRPRNPGNRADAIEMKALGYFREDPRRQVLFMPFSGPTNEPFYLYARPIWIEDHCLKCHGRREDAPEIIRATYAEGYDYEVGQLRGILSVRLPAASLDAAAWNQFIRRTWPHSLGLLAMFAAIGLVIRRDVRRPLDRLAAGIEAVAGGDYGQRIGGFSADFARIADSFNRMAAHIPEQYREIRKLSAAVEQSPAMVMLTDTEGRIEYVNPRFTAISGYTPAEVVGRTPGKFRSDAIPTDDYDQLWQALNDGRQWRGEFLNRRKDGGSYWVLASITPVRDEAGQVTHFLGVMEDITDRREAEERLRRTIDQLASSNAELERFAHIAAHDLQEPLRSVSSYAQLLSRRYKGRLDADADDFIGYMVGGVERMQALMNDLVSYSRLQPQGRPFAPVDTGKAVEAALSNLHAAIAESGGTVSCGPLPTVAGDEMQLMELFQNLVGNALKFRHPDVPPVVRIGAEQRDGDWLFSVADNGIGIAPEYHEHIFTIFERLHTQETYPGTGIGLAICRRVVERHGGRVWVESEPGAGTVFRFILPDSAQGAMRHSAAAG